MTVQCCIRRFIVFAISTLLIEWAAFLIKHASFVYISALI